MLDDRDETQEPEATPAAAAKRGEDRFDAQRVIRVRGAREHNLAAVDLELPRDRLVVITGLSGSGKSSLAFDTLFAEGQRKYMESLSAYARQFLDQLRKPDVESIEGLPPTIAIEQRQGSQNPRSTVATSTEIYDYLRLLFARAGRPTCWHREAEAPADGPRCGRPIRAADPSLIARAAATLPEGTRLMVLAPIVRGRKGHHRDVVEKLAKGGFVRARVDGALVSLDEALARGGDNPLGLGRHQIHDIDVVVDRLVVRPESGGRLAESVETALKWGEGVVLLSEQRAEGWEDTTYSERFACVEHPECALEELEPRLFSFNAPAGACPACHGLGARLELDPALVLPDHALSIERGAVEPLSKQGPTSAFGARLLARFARRFGLSPKAPLSRWSEAQRALLLYGEATSDVAPVAPKKGDSAWEGVIPMLQGWFEKTDSDNVREHLVQYMADTECPECLGERLSIRALSVWLDLDAPLPAELVARRARLGLSADPRRLNISDFTHLDIDAALEVLGAMRLGEEAQHIAVPILREIRARLGFLTSVGLGYLSLDRKTGTLSGGEAQRIRLATQVGSGIVGAAYVLDEPSIGLHPRDNERLIRTLRHLTDIGNTVIVVEHDEEMIRSADHVVDMGPGPGVHGGRVVAQGPIEAIVAAPESLTGKYLSGALRVPVPATRRRPDPARRLGIRGARENNLRDVDVDVPLGLLVCVTGVSGSGKSTLVNDVLLAAVRRHFGDLKARPGAHRAIEGLQHIGRVVQVDQSPIGRTPRSNPATYTGIFDEIRKLFAGIPDARARGYGPGRFSFNVKGGRCEACQGQGVKKVEMHFLPDVFVTCEVCRGLRYNVETLAVRYRGLNIAEVLSMTIESAASFFSAHRRVASLARCLVDVGLGYLELGQPSTTLSGGEAQRVKLATELGKYRSARSESMHTLFVLDEPTTGLHFEDVCKLTEVIDRFTERGDTVVVIEHNLDVVKRADWIVDLGPEGGGGGGRVLATGSPEAVAAHPDSLTGAFLRPLLAVPRPGGTT